MLLLSRSFFAFLFISLSCFRWLRFAESKLPQEEVDALKEITTVMGATDWKFDSDSCQIEMVGLTPALASGSEGKITCDCSSEKDNFCHVVNIVLRGYNLPGMLPPQLVKLPYLQEVDFSLNYLNGTIPKEWASMKLWSISLFVNRLSGEIPEELGNITTLKYLNLEANQFSGLVPSQLGSLFNLQTLILSSNNLSGNLPGTLALLKNLRDFRINGNSFVGKIPSFIQNWKQLQRLEMLASGLEGPIPSNISLLSNLFLLRISDITGPSQIFPFLSNMTGMRKLILRNCNITGELPSYIWTMENLDMLDVSFNKLVGEIPAAGAEHVRHPKFVFLTGNKLSGNVPDSILKDGTTVDLSYNNFTWQGLERSACRDNLNLNLNLFRSSLGTNELQDVLPCSKPFNCPRYSSCLHVNSGGQDVMVTENDENILYIRDDAAGGAAKYFNDKRNYWGLSSTGDFMDDNDSLNTHFIKMSPSSNMPELYQTARVAPTSLTYFHYCLENGKYTVHLHFAEILFTNDRTYTSLGRRLFDIYVQEKLVRKDFNIEAEAHAAQKPHVIPIYNVTVTNSILEIRFYWAGKGTTRIPYPASYGPLISAFSIVSDSKPCSSHKRRTNYIVVGVGFGVAALCLVLIIIGIFWWNGCCKGIIRREGIKGQDSQMGTFTLKQIRAATDYFNPANKIGEGGFGPVYKGQLSDGTWVAVKQLSSKSRQGNREFLNEIGMISCLQHPNLVKLHGCCIEKDQLILVYEYMENNSLANALFSSENQLKLDWPTRHRICIGIAKGLTFLHEESRLKIVHRDIKATNVLLDENLNPKISDFGLARLDEEEKTHVSTRVAGTIGYMAPEYALWGHLSYKADVYSFGIVVLEIVSGKNNKNYIQNDNCFCLIDKALHLQQTARLLELVDERLESEVNTTEAENMMKVALLCTNVSPSLRPTMSEVVDMLEGRTSIPDVIPEPSEFSEDIRFRAMRDILKQREIHSLSSTQTDNSTGVHVPSSSSISGKDILDSPHETE